MTASSTGGTALPRGKILIADDDRFVIKLLELILAREGFEVITAENGEQALSIARRERPVLALLDIEMPGLDGYATCRALLEDPATRAIPVIFLSSRREVADRVAGLELGAADFVAKPFEPRELLARIRGSLHKAPLVAARGAAIPHTPDGAGTAPGEVERARAMRAAQLVRPLPDLPGIELGAAVHDGGLVVTDFYDAVERGGRLVVVVGRVAEGTSLATAAYAAALQSFLRHGTTFWTTPSSGADPAALKAELDEFVASACRADTDVALVVAAVAAPGTLRIAGAGTVLIGRAGAETRPVPTGAASTMVGLGPGDLVLVAPTPGDAPRGASARWPRTTSLPANVTADGWSHDWVAAAHAAEPDRDAVAVAIARIGATTATGPARATGGPA